MVLFTVHTNTGHQRTPTDTDGHRRTPTDTDGHRRRRRRRRFNLSFLQNREVNGASPGASLCRFCELRSRTNTKILGRKNGEDPYQQCQHQQCQHQQYQLSTSKESITCSFSTSRLSTNSVSTNSVSTNSVSSAHQRRVQYFLEAHTNTPAI